MTGLWLVQRQTRNAGIVDAGWAACLLVASVAYFLFLDGALIRRSLILLTGGLWALRLTVYIYFDRILGRKEDGRYVYLREYWAAEANRKLFWFFQAQAVAALVLSLPWFVVASSTEQSVRLIDILGLFLFFVSLIGESVADRQLANFRHEPENRGRSCRVGLWRYSRHPNYFFEWIHWWAYVCFAYGQSWWLLTALAPVAMFVLLTRYTGIPYTEQQALRSRGDDYRKYQQETNAFFPWFPDERGG